MLNENFTLHCVLKIHFSISPDMNFIFITLETNYLNYERQSSTFQVQRQPCLSVQFKYIEEVCLKGMAWIFLSGVV